MSVPVESLVIPAALDGERVDRALALLLDFTRSEIQALIEAGDVLVDGNTVAKSRRLAENEVVDVLTEPAAAGLPQPQPDVPVEERFADDDVLVVAKPAGLIVHPGAGHPDGTLVNGLLALYPEIADVGDPTRPGIVHRLDRETSGLMVVARSAPAYEGLVSALAARQVRREYIALVWGVPSAARGVIDAPIGRSSSRRTRMAVREGGRDARTKYEVEEELTAVARLRCSLETGRTHQIRVHLAAIGHPVVGDAAYGGARQSLRVSRPFLHAAALSFTHPVTGERLSFEEPLPSDLADVLAKLRSTSGPVTRR